MMSHESKLSRVAACRSDLRDNGIDLYGRGHRRLAGLVRRHLGYFQLMLGYDVDLREVVTLLQDTRGPGGGRRGR
jgi:hypothetical protein